MQVAAALRIEQAASPYQVALARELFLEYSRGLGIDLCFQNFQQELDTLPGDYAPPDGRLFLAFRGNRAVGCAALRRFDQTTCEMKRLYVRPAFRGTGAGRRLAQQVIEEARRVGYSWMVLDTLPSMTEAQELYRSLGFREIPPYRSNPVPGALFLKLALT